MDIQFNLLIQEYPQVKEILVGERLGKLLADNVLNGKPKSQYEKSPFNNIMDDLNKAKSLLDPIYKSRDKNKINLNNALAKKLDLYATLPDKLTKGANAQNVNNAWLKYYELFNLMAFSGTPKDKEYKVFFNAELPGGSLCAWNHYVKTVLKFDYDWRASSLIQDVQSVDSSALIDSYGLYNHNKDHWMMNDANDGDCTKIETLEYFEREIGPQSKYGGVDLYSHDAGIDVSSDFNNQEQLNAKLHLGCMLAGLLTMKPGATFIGKQYTYFEPFTWNVILLASTMFETFHLIKPLTSRARNSEIYLVGLGYKGADTNRELINYLLNRIKIDDCKTPLIDEKIIYDYLESQLHDLMHFAQSVFEFQARCLKLMSQLSIRFASSFITVNELGVKIKNIYDEEILKWLKLYPVFRLNQEDKLTDNNTHVKKITNLPPNKKFFNKRRH